MGIDGSYASSGPWSSDPVSGPISSHARIQSWIPPSFAWTTMPDAFNIEVPLNDPDIVELMSTGVREVTVKGTKATAPVLARLIGRATLRGQLEESVWAPAKLKPTGSRIKAGTKVIAHCHGVFLLPDGKTLSVVVGRTKPVAPDSWMSASLKAEADALLAEHQAKVAEFDEHIRLKKQAQDALKERYKSDQNFGAFDEAMVAIEELYQRPVVTIEPLLQSLTRAAKFPQPTSGDTEKIAGAAIAAIAASGWPPSRDGNYAGILSGAAGRRTQGMGDGSGFRVCRRPGCRVGILIRPHPRGDHRAGPWPRACAAQCPGLRAARVFTQ